MMPTQITQRTIEDHQMERSNYARLLQTRNSTYVAFPTNLNLNIYRKYLLKTVYKQY